jgi:cysteinyl-tRNA synthetase
VSGLVLYDTRARRKRPFEPMEPGHVRMYTCGPTVYAPQHVGNLRSQLFADLAKRAFLAEGWRVTHVINVTDVGHLTDDADAGEDKLERAARESGERADAIARRYTEQWLRDRARVGCLPPEVLCRASEHVPEQIELARVLEARGYTYRIPDGIYFDTSKFPRYADFARLDLAGQVGGARIGDVAGKRHPADFALWKLTPAGVRRQQEWDSPWGRGFPGWHLECSAMSIRYLGRNFDVHTGGVDHVAVHHTNEIAQSECAFDVHPWVAFWLHNEFLDFRGAKMSKSQGNVCLLGDVVERGFPPLAFRYFFLQAHYRQPQTLTDHAMEAAATGYDRLLAHALEAREAPGEPDPARGEALRARFREAVRDDLNAPRALAVAWDAARSRELGAPERAALLRDFDAVLGLELGSALPRAAQRESDPRIEALLAEREAARRRRDFTTADRLREALAAEGIAVEDTPAGPRWRRVRA